MAIFGLVIVTVAVAWHGLVAMLAWNWFVPQVLGGPVLAYWQALGLCLVASALVPRGGEAGAARDEDGTAVLGRSAERLFLHPLVILALAAIVHVIM